MSSDKGPQPVVSKPARVIPKFSSFKPALPSAAPTTTDVVLVKQEDEVRSDKEKDRRKDKDRNHRRYYRSHSRSRDRHCRDRDRERDKDKNKETGDVGERDRRRYRHHRSNRSWERRRHRDENRSSRRDYSRSRSPRPPRTELQVVKRPSPSVQEWDQPEDQFVLDTKGDKGNEIYGTLHQYSVPLYRRSGMGRIIGLPPNVSIDSSNWDGKSLALRDRRKFVGTGQTTDERNKYGFARAEREGVKRLRVKKDETGLEEAFARGLDFVPFGRESKKRKKREDEIYHSDDMDEDDEDEHYRSILGPKKKSDQPEDKDLEFAEDSQSDGDYVKNDEWGDRGVMAELARKVEGKPKDIDAWLAYVAHHDTIVHSTGRRKTAAEKTSTAEIKLDILTKALDKNPGNEQLILKFMDVAEEIWDGQKLLTKWRTLLEENPTIFCLWTRYINFRQTDFLSFTYPKCTNIYSESLIVLRAAAFRAKTNSERGKTEDIIVYVFLRTTLMMYEAGYTEIAIASFQAMLELNIFRKPEIPAPANIRQHEEALASFEKFWDTEAPRVGEDNAKGWKSMMDADEPPEPRMDGVAELPLEKEDLFGSWTDNELEWIARSSLPARTQDEIEEDDPYRVILFRDFQEYMFIFTSPSAVDKLIEAFLVFWNLPPLAPQSSNSNENNDGFLHSGVPETRNKEFDVWFWPPKSSKWDEVKMIIWEGMEPERKDLLGDDPFHFKLLNSPIGTEMFFSKSGKWFDGIGAMKMDHGHSHYEKLFVKQALSLISINMGNKELALYYLAWEWANFGQSAFNTAKILLAKFKTYLPLWSAFAQIFWYDDKPDAGRKIFTMALGMSQNFSEATKFDAIHLWHAWIWEEIHARNINDALRLLLSIENGTPITEAISPDTVPKPLLLRSQRYLVDLRDRHLGLAHYTISGVANDLLALLSHLSHSQPLESTLSMYTTHILALSVRTAPPHLLELTHLRHVRLASLAAATTKPFKPATLRAALEAGLDAFPANTALLALYAHAEVRTKVANRLRGRVLAPTVDSTHTVYSWLFSVYTELRISAHPSPHAVRAVLQRALSTPRGRSSALLWRVTIEFEARNTDWERAREVWFRALNACPWSKELAMVGLVRLKSALSFEDSRRVVGIVATEKELRFHDVTELEDEVEEVVQQREEEESARRLREIEEEGQGMIEEQW